MCKSKNKARKLCCYQKTDNGYLKELKFFEEIKPTCQSLWIPIVALAVFAALLFVPLQCSSQTTCKCCCSDTNNEQTTFSIQYIIDLQMLLKEIRSDSLFRKRNIVISPDQITIRPQISELWPLIIFRIAGATILLLAIVFILKYLVPYWMKIAEYNNRQNEKIINEILRLSQEENEVRLLPRKTQIALLEKEGKTIIEERIKAKEHERKMAIMDKELSNEEIIKTLNIIKELCSESNNAEHYVKMQALIDALIEKLINKK